MIQRHRRGENRAGGLKFGPNAGWDYIYPCKVSPFESVGPMICERKNGKRMPAGSTWSRVGSNPTRSFTGRTQLSPMFVAAAMMIERRMPKELHESSVAGSNPVVRGNAGVVQW